jgi:predicted amidohydrolase
MKATIVFALLWLLLASSVAAGADPALRVVAVQLELREEAYASVDAFRAWIADRVERCLPYRPDLIVFPEYTAVFVALIPYHRALRSAGTLPEGWQAIQREEPLAGSLRELFLLNAGFVERMIADVFGGLARRHGVYILGGSYFAPAGDGAPRRNGPWEAQLRNRAFLVGPSGAVVYRQDKVFLTEFEIDVIGLSSGRLEDARGFGVDGRRIGLTICRDTFHREWEERFRGYDLWLDIKANGAAYTPEEAASFQRALPARIGPAGVEFGITACLTGRFLDLFWEGESSVVRADERSVRPIRVASSPRGEEILPLAIPPEETR